MLSAEFVFAVPVSSMLGFLSLPLCWVFFVFSFHVHAGAFPVLGFCCAWPPSHGGQAEVLSARLNPRNGTIDVGDVCNFLCSVSSQKKYEVMDGPPL